MIKVILWDIDGTILDFAKAEYNGIKNCFRHFGLEECTDVQIAGYASINDKYWEMLERGEITRQKLFTERFREFFQGEGIEFSQFAEFNQEYQKQLGTLIYFRDRAYDLIKELKGNVLQYAVTNGSYNVQKYKLEKSGLKDLFDDCFISDQIGMEKPSKEFFDHVKKKIGAVGDDEIMIVGDSLTSDMKGGNNAGIICCWYNPNQKPNGNGLQIDHEITNLWQVKEIILKE